MKIIRGKHFSEPPIALAKSAAGSVYAFGYTYIPSGAPDLLNIVELQSGNKHPLNKLTLKHSDEIQSNYIGCCTTRIPRISDNDERPVECVNLIDGNPDSCWLSKTQPRIEMNPVWIRVDLPREQCCDRIVLRKMPKNPKRIVDETCWGPEPDAVWVGRGMPGHLTVEVSVDGCLWDTVFEGETQDDESKEFFEVKMETRPVRMVRITGRRLAKVENQLYSFSIASVEIYDVNGNNVALVSKGAGVSVNSTAHSHGQEMEVQRTLFPVHYDLGLKWVRIGYHDDVINWHWVERKKGELKIDPYADAVITELKDNGVETMMCLNFGNRLYSERPERVFPQLWEYDYEPPLPPKTEEALAAFANYCRFMVRHFRDRINYFEIWNEWNGACYWNDKVDVERYINLVKMVIPIIREEAPEAKVVLGSFAGFLVGCSKWTPETWEKNEKSHMFMRAIAALAKNVDVIGFHPVYNVDPDSDHLMYYEEDLQSFDTYCREKGFQGVYSASEYNYGNCVPSFESKDRNWWGTLSCTEFEKAMYIARLIAIHTRYGISSMFCETFNSVYPLDLSLFRRTVTQDPVDAQQPQAAYYMMRNLCTILDGAEGCEGSMKITGAVRKFAQAAYIQNGDKIFGAWTVGRGSENNQGETVDLVLDGEYTTLTAYDPANGVQQELEFSVSDGKTSVKNWILREYPVFIRCRH